MSVPVPGGGGDTYVERLSETVSWALDREDISTVLRTALEVEANGVRQVEAFDNKKEKDEDEEKETKGRDRRGEGGDRGDGVGEAVVQQALDFCIAEDSKEIEFLCRKNCSDFVQTIDELSGLKLEAEQLKRQIETHCDSLVKRNEPELKLLRDLASCYSTIESYQEARRELGTTVEVLELLERAESGENQDHFDVLQCLDKVKDILDTTNESIESPAASTALAKHLSLGLDGSVRGENGSGGGAVGAVSPSGRGDSSDVFSPPNGAPRDHHLGSSKGAHTVVRGSKALTRFLDDQIMVIKGRMRQGIEDDFNDWLLEARTKEKEVARHKLEEAKRIMETARETSARHRETLRAVRAQWGRPLHEVLASAAGKGGLPLKGRDEETNPFQETTDDFPLDLTTLHRCRYLYDKLGLKEAFGDYYRKQRVLQLRSDLEARGNQTRQGSFLDQIRDQMDRVLGFMMIEDRVFHSTRGIITRQDMEGEWEEALSVLMGRLDDWLASGKNFLAEAGAVCGRVALSCTIAAHYDLRFDPLKDLTARASEVYGKTLQKECTEWIGAICKGDLAAKVPLLPTSGGTGGEGEGSTEWGLGETEGVARYSASVPEVVNLVLTLIKDGLTFVETTRIGESLTFPCDFYDPGEGAGEGEAFQQVSDIAESIVNLCVLPLVKEMVADPQNDLKEATQMMANIYFGFIPAFQGLSTYVRTLCSNHHHSDQGGPAGVREMNEVSGEALALILQSPEHVSRDLEKNTAEILYELMDMSEENVLEILCAKVDSYSANYIMMDWCPRGADLNLLSPQDEGASPASPAGAKRLRSKSELCKESECMQEISFFIERMSDDCRKKMPPYLHKHLFSQVFKHAADHILQLLSCSAVSKFNLISIVQLKADMQSLKRLAMRTLEDDSVDILFASLVQVLDYLVSCVPESILDPKVKVSLYPMVNTQTLGRLLFKYQEMPKDHKMAFLSKAPAKQTMEELAQKLLTAL